MSKKTNEKNDRNRASVTLDRKWHRRFRIMAAQRDDLTIEDLVDEAACAYLKSRPAMVRAQGGE